MYKFFILPILLISMISCSSSSQEQSEVPKETVHHRVNVETFTSKMAEEGVVLLDVRTPQEIKKGKIEGALELNVNDENFEKEVEKLDKNKTYLVYCQGGVRSNKACKKMEDLGFKNLYDLKPGYKGWIKNQE